MNRLLICAAVPWIFSAGCSDAGDEQPQTTAMIVSQSEPVSNTNAVNRHAGMLYSFTPDDFANVFDSQSPRRQLRDAIDRIRRTVDMCRNSNQQEVAAEIERQLTSVLEDKQGPATQKSAARLHVVGLYEGQEQPRRGGRGVSEPAETAIVHVTDTSGPVTVCVCAYSPVEWTFEVADGVDLRHVIASGYYPQSLVNIPDGVTVEGHLHKGKDANYRFSAYSREADWLVVKRNLLALTGLDISTRFGQYEFSGSPFVLGPDNPDWAAQMTLSRLRPVYQLALSHYVRTTEARLTKTTFPMICIAPGNSAHAHEGSGGSDGTASVAAAGVFGPYTETMQPLQQTVRQIVQHRELGLLGVANDGLVIVDPENGTLTNFDVPELESITSDWSIALDPGRNRLYLWGKRLISIELHSKAIRIHRKDNPSIQAIAFSPKDDCLYGISSVYDGGSSSVVTALRKFNLRGAELEQFRLTTPIIGSQHQHGGRMQMMVIEDRVVVVPDQNRLGGDRNYIIDPSTGRTTFVCLRRPR